MKDTRLKPFLVDTHAHICDDGFDHDRSRVIDRAVQSGVSAIIAVGETLKDAKKNLDLAKTFSVIKPAAGLYPDQLDRVAADEMIAFIQSNRADLWAIGEVGLDFWVVKTEQKRALQKAIFQQFIRLSNDLGLPLNVHSRSAGRHAVDLLIRGEAKKVQMHAFDGKFSAAEPAVEAGYYFSIPPSIMRSRQKQKLLKHLPVSCLLAETDSPVLGPDPKMRNEPANLMLSIQAISEIKGISISRVMEAIEENTRKLYGF